MCDDTSAADLPEEIVGRRDDGTATEDQVLRFGDRYRLISGGSSGVGKEPAN